ncbi:MAG TPA: DUF4345 family protein [Myxococcota bacterium]|nr:DUF4345 family protein [Myxococcota bacterium]
MIALLAAFLFGVGLVAVCQPARVGALFETDGLAADARDGVRAVYGGLGLAMATWLGLALATPSLRMPGLACLAASVVGLAFGCVVSRVVDGTVGSRPRLVLGVELALSGALLAALRAAF